MRNARGLPAAVVFDRRNMRELIVLPVGSRLETGDGQAQLWIVTGAGATPVGVVRTGDETRLPLDKPMLTAVMAAKARLLVTRERTASPPAAGPGGPRLAEGAVALLGASSP